MVPDIPSFEELIGDRLSKIEEIGQMQTVVVLGEIKSLSSYPIYAEK